MPLMELPTEIHFEVLDKLDYVSLINFTKANQYLYSLRSEKLLSSSLTRWEQLSDTERDQFLEKFGTHPTGTWRTVDGDLLRRFNRLLPCYGCLKLRRQSGQFFCFRQSHGQFDMDGPLARNRRCNPCRKRSPTISRNLGCI